MPTLTTYLICYAVTTLVFFAIDMVWLGGVAKNLYATELGDLMAKNVKWGAAIGFYLIYIVGILFFASRFGLEAGSALKAAGYGAAFGFFCYATYDLTNYATLEGWPSKIVFIDIIWGTVLTGATAGLGVWLTQMIVR